MRILTIILLLSAAGILSAAPISIFSRLDVPGEVSTAADGLSAQAHLEGRLTGSWRLQDLDHSGSSFSAVLETAAFAAPQARMARAARVAQAAFGEVSVQVDWVSALLVVEGGEGDGVAYFDAGCNSWDYAGCVSNVDLNSGAFQFTFGVPFRLELQLWANSTYSGLETESAGVHGWLNPAAAFQTLSGDPLEARLALAGEPDLVHNPEPATWLSMAGGLAVLLWRARRRARLS